MSASEARFPRSWRQRLLLVPFARLVQLWFRPRLHGLEQVPLERPVLDLGKHPRTYLYLEVILLGPPDRIDWEGRLGFARLAARARLPVVPIALVGADQQHPWGLRLGKRLTLWLPPIPLPVRFDFWFGAPLPPPPEDAPAVEAFARRVVEATQALLDRGVAERRGGRAA